MASSSTQPRIDRLDSIQAFRGIAATAVVLHHACNELGIVRGQNLAERHWFFNTDIGSAGVDLFFIISGFIMVYTTQSKSTTASRFLLQRSIRIYPLYWLCSIVGILIYLSPWLQLYDEFRNHGIEYVKSFFLYPSFGAGAEQAMVRPRPLGQGWTLVYEMVFYGIFALALIFNRGRRATFASVGVVALWAGSHLLPSGVWRALLADSIILEFVFGMALAHLFVATTVQFSTATSRIFLGVSAAALLGAATIPVYLESVPRVIVFGIPCLLIAAGIVLNRRERQAPKWLLLLGDASYSLYLTHGLTMLLFRIGYSRSGAIRALPQPVYFVMLLLAVFPIGILCYLLFERPVTQFLKDRIVPSRAAKIVAKPHVTPTPVG